MNEHSKKLRVVGVGAGYFSQFHYDAWARLDNVELVAVVDLDHSKAQAIADKYQIPLASDNLAATLRDIKPDLLDVITPPASHQAAISLAAELGINCVCQKPFGENLEQAQHMVTLAQQANIDLIVHENFRFMPWFRQVKQIIESGQLGEIFNAQFYLRPGDGQGKDAYLARQPYFQTMDKFLVHETAIHIVDTFRYLFGEVKSLYANLKQRNPVLKGEDAGTIIFDMHNGVEAVFNGNRLLDHAATNKRRTMGEMLIEGSKACLRLDGEARLWLRPFDQLQAEPIAYQWQDKNFGGDCVFQLCQHIAQHYLSNQALENSAAQYLRNIEIENAIYQSNSLRAAVDI
ncbi:dehydrogenase [Saccharobesus litoralis]|uniref:Dehydrogenase n=1 Tax=Saccharobesus litoralis TaxID=2172099 RepID=A0A2S0VNS2_9ALTE|nr:Gfo/Idh/MocA family oxidoreductase [Saccharobesus litoralis]AWB65867.1 dehydrogenase [Saccharobesus litoralis]